MKHHAKPGGTAWPDAKVITDGTHRVASFAQTWSAVAPRMAAMGITRVGNVTGLDDIGIPVVMVCRPNARTLSVSQGKGLTLQAARISGVMEAAELFHAEEVEPSSFEATPAAMSRHAQIVDVQALALQRGAGPARGRALAWMKGEDLMSGGPRWVPWECVQLGRVTGEQRVFANTSSGLASGNSLPEAISHAICELVEQHALSIWLSLPGALRTATRVELASVRDAACQMLLERCAQAGVAVGVWDMSCEVQLPVFACYAAQRDCRQPRMVQPSAGFGCHPSREVALARAITEAVQGRLTHIAGARDDMTEAQYDHGTRTQFVQHVLDFIDSGTPREFERAPSRQTSRISADLQWELERLAAASVEQVVAVDLTRAELGIAVARVTIPGLRLPGFQRVRP